MNVLNPSYHRGCKNKEEQNEVKDLPYALSRCTKRFQAAAGMPMMLPADTPETVAELWRVVTHLGSASLLLPTLAITAIALQAGGQARAMRVWLASLGLAALVTTVSKLLFFGWGVGVASLNFTGVSGHALLATAVLPVLFAWLLSPDAQDRASPPVAGRSPVFSRRTGLALGLLVSLAVGVSRVVLGAHSPSEVVAAWLLGLGVATYTIKAMEHSRTRPWFAVLAPAVLLLAFGSAASNYLPTHDWEVRLALALSGREKAYTRHQLLAPPQAHQPAHDGA